VRPIHHPAADELDLAEVLHALSDPVRLAVVAHLANQGENPCGSLSCKVAKSTLSHHLKVLREAGLTHTRAEGTQRLLSLRRTELDTRFPGLLDAVLRSANGSGDRSAGLI
jgi:DNA-binding transcriptional ArsR family regulator